MNKIIKTGFAAIALAFVFNFFAVTDASAQANVLNEILKRMENHKNSLSSLRASARMLKYNAQLQESDTYEGTTLYLPIKGRDANVRIDWVRPAEETLSVVNGQYVIYRPRLKQAITGNAKAAQGSGKANSALSFMNMSREQLRANYTVRYLGQENVSGGIPTWRLELTPKTAEKYKLAELWVDGNGMPIQAKVVENNDDSTTILLSNLQKNVNLNVSLFKLNLPKGTQIVRA